VLAADQDIIFREPLVKALADAIPGSKYHCFQNCGHIPYLEYPEEFVRVVSGFCN
jgi:3-oxoadipate enol-lactonase